MHLWQMLIRLKQHWKAKNRELLLIARILQLPELPLPGSVKKF